MNEERERHLALILTASACRIDRKYRAGQAEHGGDLFRKPLGEELIAEAVDQVIYSLTKREQDLQSADFLSDFVNRNPQLPDEDIEQLIRIIRLLE